MALTIVTEFNPIEEINTDKAFWNIKAKIIRLWQVTDFNNPRVPFSFEMVLMDSDGGRIRATIRKTLLYKFKNDVLEGKTYAFEKLGVASNGDVIGVLTGVGSERGIEKNGGTTKLNVIALEADGHKIQCTLFGNYCDDLNNFIATGDVHGAVVIIQLAKAKTFQDKVHLQNCMACTRLVFNLDCDEARDMKSRIADITDTPSPMTLTQLAPDVRVSPLDEFLYNTPRSTIQGLKDATTDSLFVVLGTIKKILNPETYSYTACSCSKVVIPDSQMLFCDKCDKHVVRVCPRFCIKVRVLDNTDCGTMVIFDNDVTLLFRKTCQAVLDFIPRDAPSGFLPNELVGLVEQTLLFKVETKPKFNTKFEQSFRVRKICSDANVINTFKKKWDNEDAPFSKSANETASLSTLMDKGKRVLGEGSSHGLSQDIVCLSSPNLKLKDKVGEHDAVIKEDLMPKFGEAGPSADLTPPTISVVKRSSPTAVEEEDMDLPLKLLKRSIKINKLI
ncbi:unnamed protein product [Trifolium pratense]|uniref:Uncharacterized protein n=1 Tax=Trifolium pratense TaxID=57577 RepID=A0ACB0IUZ0_TRIPR|nr:unnamed protein product [Trifolium pratense]